MKTYNYKARSEKGETVEGVLEAISERQVAMILRGKGLLTVSVSENQVNELANLLSKFNKPKLDEIVVFTRQMSTMIEAGLSLVDALGILKDQSGPGLELVLGKVLTEVEGGKSFALALEESDGGFSSVYIALVKVGESAGLLDKVMMRMADTLEAEKEFRSKTKGALVYPAIVLLGMVAVGVIMMVFVMPRMTVMYTDMGIELPMITRVLIGISDFMVKFWYLLLFGVGGGVVFLSRWVKTEIGGLLVEQLQFKLPIWGQLKKDIIVAKFARTTGLLISAGISVLDALRIVADTLGSRIFGDAIRRVATRVEKGVSLADGIGNIEEFPIVLTRMIAVGEQTGKMDDVLTRLAVYYESESATKVKALTTAIEPLIMIVMGVGVGLLVAAVILPIYHLTSQF
ncbi:type II secretion system F family protein [Patescibacteria group bacterium]|nr:type II secretion system F family protein [Patescibacteria group bacterium]